jgi:hypothetical protein
VRENRVRLEPGESHTMAAVLTVDVRAFAR